MTVDHLPRRLVSFARRLKEYLRNGSALERDQTYLQQLREDPSLAFLVSFPRTGSHWLRMLTEDYTGQPTMRRTFYHPLGSDPILFHLHDLDLSVCHPNVVYLHRDPIPTIYSQIRYHGASPFDEEAIEHWGALYGAHLRKWLDDESFTETKTVLTYEEMKDDLATAFSRVLTHLDIAFEAERFRSAQTRVTKEEVDRKTRHDSNVVNKDDRYYRDRERFRDVHGETVRAIVRDARKGVREPPVEA